MSNKTKFVLAAIVIAGVIIPFVDYLVIIEMFYLQIPIGIAAVVCLLFLIVSLFGKSSNIQEAVVIGSIIPIFIGAQLLSVFTVNIVQKAHSESVIQELERLTKQGNVVPVHYETPLGIGFKKGKDPNFYEIRYSRGFMVTERYDSRRKTWRSYGWND